MTNLNILNTLPEIRRANDSARAGWMPASVATNAWVSENASGENYKRYYKTNCDKLLIYLHTWSADYTQLSSNSSTYPSVNPANGNSFGGFATACPNFGGANNNSSSMSDAAIDGIKLAIDEAKYRTGLSRVYLAGVSGGATAGLSFMGRYPGVVHRASLWLPVYNLAQWYINLQTSDPTDTQGLQANMRAIFGAAPSSASDAAYVARSPQARLPSIYGPTKIFINTGSSDTTALASYGTSAASAITGASSDCDVTLINWSGMGHTFGPSNDGFDCMKQLLLE